MREYKFKLNALLRLRIFKEKGIKQKLGEIVSEIDNLNNGIEKLEKGINSIYEYREKAMSLGLPVKVLSFYSKASELKWNEMQLKKKKVLELYKKYGIKMKELKMAMGDVKLIEKVREKDFKLFKKEKDRKEQRGIEELLQYRIAEEGK